MREQGMVAREPGGLGGQHRMLSLYHPHQPEAGISITISNQRQVHIVNMELGYRLEFIVQCIEQIIYSY